MEQKQIDQLVQDDFEKFYNSFYDGVPFPENFQERFRKALMVLPPNAHGIPTGLMQQLATVNPSDITWGQTDTILKVIIAIPFEKLYDNLEDALNQNGPLEAFRQHFLNKLKEVEEGLKRKRDALSNLAGTQKAPMKIIKAQA